MCFLLVLFRQPLPLVRQLLLGVELRDASGLEMWAADDRRSGIAHFDLWDERLHDEHLRELADAVDRIRDAQRITFVIVSVCWGTRL